MNEQQLNAAADAFGIEDLKELVRRIGTPEQFADTAHFEALPASRWELYHMDVRYLRGHAISAGTFGTDPHWTVGHTVLLLKHVARHRLAANPQP